MLTSIYMRMTIVLYLSIFGTTLSIAKSSLNEPCKDTIYLTNGKIYPIQYIRELGGSVRYRSCYTNLKTTKSKSEIIKIVFEDGRSSSFAGDLQKESDDRPPEVDKRKRKSKDRALGRGQAFVVISLVSSALLLLVMLVILV